MNDSKDILVSVVCLSYNHEKYIRDALDGFVMQKTNFGFEVIIHDDASTDNTIVIIKEYAEKYPDIIKPIFEKENQYSKPGGDILGKTIMACQGKYLAFCEGDDYWIDPNKLQKQVDYLEEHPECSLCCTDAVLNTLNGDKERSSLVMKKTIVQWKLFSVVDGT